MISRHKAFSGRRSFCLLLLLFVLSIEAAYCENVVAGQADSETARVRDRLHVWTHPAGSHDNYYLAPHTHVKSRTTPVEGALYLGVPNLYFIQYTEELPPLEDFRKYAISFRPMKEVVWSLTGMAGRTSPETRAHVLELAEEFPNISGFILDDFIKWGKLRSHEMDPHWVADNLVTFPVTLTFTPPQPTLCDRIELVQSDWPTEDYRTKEFVIFANSGGNRMQVAEGVMPNVGGALVSIDLPGNSVEEVTIEIRSTYDTDKAKSCGLKEVRFWFEGRQITTSEEWEAEASSTYQSKFHKPEFLFITEWSNAEELTIDTSTAPVAASLTPEELAELRSQTVINGKRVPIVCGVYENQISQRIMPHIDQVDKVALWTWFGRDLIHLEKNFEELENLVAPKPILLGCYMYDYGANKPLTVEQMEYQCERGLEWLRAGRIEGMIFLGSNICDQELEAVEWTREWVSKVGDEPL